MSGQGWVGSIVYLFFSDSTAYHARGRKQSPEQAGSQSSWKQVQAYGVAGVGGFSKSLSVIVLLSKGLLWWYLMKQLSKTILFVFLYWVSVWNQTLYWHEPRLYIVLSEYCENIEGGKGHWLKAKATEMLINTERCSRCWVHDQLPLRTWLGVAYLSALGQIRKVGGN